MAPPEPVPNQAFLDSVLSIPIHRALGLTLTAITPATSSATATFTTTPFHLSPTNTLHGGITTSQLDSVCFLATIPSLKSGQNADGPYRENAVTVASSYQLIGAVEGVGKVVELEGRVVKRGRSVAFCESVATCDGRLVGKGSLTKMIIKVPVQKEVSSKI